MVEERITKVVVKCLVDKGKQGGEAEIGGNAAEVIPNVGGFAFEFVVEEIVEVSLDFRRSDVAGVDISRRISKLTRQIWTSADSQP